MLKNPFSNSSYISDEADVVAINDNRAASLNRFRRLTSANENENIEKYPEPELMLNQIQSKNEPNGVYTNKALVLDEEISTASSPDPSSIGTGATGGRPPKVAVDVRDVTFTYGFGQKSLLTLKKINVSVPQGKIYALLGSSGCGKCIIIIIIVILTCLAHTHTHTCINT